MGSALTAAFLRLMGCAFSKHCLRNANHQPARSAPEAGPGEAKATPKKTRPSAQYNANGLASPGH
jgi:hypothetical protein